MSVQTDRLVFIKAPAQSHLPGAWSKPRRKVRHAQGYLSEALSRHPFLATRRQKRSITRIPARPWSLLALDGFADARGRLPIGLSSLLNQGEGYICPQVLLRTPCRADPRRTGTRPSVSCSPLCESEPPGTGYATGQHPARIHVGSHFAEDGSLRKRSRSERRERVLASRPQWLSRLPDLSPGQWAPDIRQTPSSARTTPVREVRHSLYAKAEGWSFLLPLLSADRNEVGLIGHPSRLQQEPHRRMTP